MTDLALINRVTLAIADTSLSPIRRATLATALAMFETERADCKDTGPDAERAYITIALSRFKLSSVLSLGLVFDDRGSFAYGEDGRHIRIME